MSEVDHWPALPLREWQDTYRTLHMWTQIVGKVHMTLSPPLNHWWHVTFYVNARGLTTGPIPWHSGVFEIQFDFVQDELRISTSAGAAASRPLRAESVADFYNGLREALAPLGIQVEINLRPQEVGEAPTFDQDRFNCSYDARYAHQLWQILVSSSRVMERFRGKFLGKCSPVHFFWGSFDLACSRFSGRLAPPRKGVISGPAYSHEVCSAGFWPGGRDFDGPAFYCYAVPAPAGFEKASVRPAAAGWNPQAGEFILMYDDVRHAESPDDALYQFLESTWDAAARLGNWDRAALEVR